MTIGVVVFMLGVLQAPASRCRSCRLPETRVGAARADGRKLMDSRVALLDFRRATRYGGRQKGSRNRFGGDLREAVVAGIQATGFIEKDNVTCS